MNITDKIKNYEDICAIDGVDPIASLPYPNSTEPEEIAVNCFAKVNRIRRVLNEGWQPDWNNYDQYKYYPWFDMETYDDHAGSGPGFRSAATSAFSRVRLSVPAWFIRPEH